MQTNPRTSFLTAVLATSLAPLTAQETPPAPDRVRVSFTAVRVPSHLRRQVLDHCFCPPLIESGAGGCPWCRLVLAPLRLPFDVDAFAAKTEPRGSGHGPFAIPRPRIPATHVRLGVSNIVDAFRALHDVASTLHLDQTHTGTVTRADPVELEWFVGTEVFNRARERARRGWAGSLPLLVEEPYVEPTGPGLRFRIRTRIVPGTDQILLDFNEDRRTPEGRKTGHYRLCIRSGQAVVLPVSYATGSTKTPTEYAAILVAVEIRKRPKRTDASDHSP